MLYQICFLGKGFPRIWRTHKLLPGMNSLMPESVGPAGKLSRILTNLRLFPGVNSLVVSRLSTQAERILSHCLCRLLICVNSLVLKAKLSG